jgi:Ca-activated chloride channel family protein
MSRGLGLLAATVLGLVSAQDQRPPVFRASASAVFVDVSVRDRGTPIKGLTAKDFEIRDNGVVQTIADVSLESMPLDVTVLSDASDSLDLRTEGQTKGVRDRLAQNATQVPALLQRDDHVQLLRFASGVSAAASTESLERGGAPEGQRTALFDSLIAVLLQPSDATRRRLVVVLTDGVDTSSTLNYELRTAVLDRAGAVVHLITTSAARDDAQFGPPGLLKGVTTTTFDDFAWVLRDVADRTGGRHFEVKPTEDFLPALGAAVEEFRTRYIIKFIPEGVDPAGWHVLSVKVAVKHDELRHKAGYWR